MSNSNPYYALPLGPEDLTRLEAATMVALNASPNQRYADVRAIMVALFNAGYLNVEERVGASTERQWRIYNMDDSEWWTAPSLDQAVAAYEKANNCTLGDHTPEELTDKEMSRLKYTSGNGDRWSFKAELQRRIDSGTVAVEMFATTEG